MAVDGVAMAVRWTEELWHQGNEGVIDEMLAPDCVIHGFGPPDAPPLQGREQFRQAYRAFRSAFSDIRYEIEEAAAQGDLVTTRVRGSARHTGDHAGAAATGRTVNFRAMVWVRIRDGLVAEGWQVVDNAPVLLEIGALRPAAPDDGEEEIRALTHRWFEEVWNQKRTAAIYEIAAPDVVAHGLGEDGSTLIGADGFVPFQQKFLGAFPDLQITVEAIVVEGDRAATHFTCRGTHLGPHLGTGPTGRKVEFSGMSLCRWKDGRIAEGWNSVDFATMLRQLTAEQPPGS